MGPRNLPNLPDLYRTFTSTSHGYNMLHVRHILENRETIPGFLVGISFLVLSRVLNPNMESSFSLNTGRSSLTEGQLRNQSISHTCMMCRGLVLWTHVCGVKVSTHTLCLRFAVSLSRLKVCRFHLLYDQISPILFDSSESHCRIAVCHNDIKNKHFRDWRCPITMWLCPRRVSLLSLSMIHTLDVSLSAPWNSTPTEFKQ